MEPATQTRYTSRPALSILVTICLVVSALIAVAPPNARAATNTCRARNLTQRTPRSSNLQAVIDAAHDGDRIVVRFVCVGNFVIAKDLTIVGRATARVPIATLTANGRGTVLRVRSGATTTLRRLKVTGGAFVKVSPGLHGGGIENRGTLTLDRSVVVWNQANGIYNTGTLILNDSVVRRNSGGWGGGINSYGNVTLNGTSSVRRNRSVWGGGGIYNGIEAQVTLNDSSSVRWNHTGNRGWGGGISNEGTVTLNGSAVVHDNTSGRRGGGIFNSCRYAGGGQMFGATDGGNVYGNSPDNIHYDGFCT